MTRIAIHGFGRIGRSLMRVALKDELFVPVSISDIKDVPTLAALFDPGAEDHQVGYDPLDLGIGAVAGFHEHHVIAAGVQNRLEQSEHFSVAVHHDDFLHRRGRGPRARQPGPLFHTWLGA